MARPREFDEAAVLDAAVDCFWRRGFEATSVRDLVSNTGITGASLYNAFGDKRALFGLALDRYVEGTIGRRIERCRGLAPRAAIGLFFDDILARSLRDDEHKGCMLVNAAVDVAPHDPAFQAAVASATGDIETFFRETVAAGQTDGTISSAVPAADLARHLLGVLMGVRVLSRIRPEAALLQGVVATALRLLDAPAGSGRQADQASVDQEGP